MMLNIVVVMIMAIIVIFYGNEDDDGDGESDDDDGDHLLVMTEALLGAQRGNWTAIVRVNGIVKIVDFVIIVKRLIIVVIFMINNQSIIGIDKFVKLSIKSPKFSKSSASSK